MRKSENQKISIVKNGDKYGVNGIPEGNRLYGFGTWEGYPGIPVENPLFFVIYGTTESHHLLNCRSIKLHIGSKENLREAQVESAYMDLGGFGVINYELNGEGRIEFMVSLDKIDNLKYVGNDDLEQLVELPIKSFFSRHD